MTYCYESKIILKQIEKSMDQFCKDEMKQIEDFCKEILNAVKKLHKEGRKTKNLPRLNYAKNFGTTLPRRAITNSS